MSGVIYLDHAATTPTRREVLEAMFPFFQQSYANPSSVHSAGREVAAAHEEARQRVAAVLGCTPGEIVFTSGGTESDNLALIGVAESRRSRGNHVVISAIEHEAVLQSAGELKRREFRISVVPVDEFGVIHPGEVADAVTDQTILVSCMYANNEIGTIQPTRDIVAAVHGVNPATLIHTDAVQAPGALPLDVSALGVDLLSLSAHKTYGPRGAGILYVRNGVELRPIIHGGGQESGRRSGTENVAATVGMAEALSLADSERVAETARLRTLRDRLIDGVLNIKPDARLTGHPTDRLPGHVSFAFSDRSAESVLVDLDREGIMCSSGSACHAGMTDPSHVLLAIGLCESEARNGLRMTLGRDTDDADIDQVLAVCSKLLRDPADSVSAA